MPSSRRCIRSHMPNMVMLQWIASVNAYLRWNKSCKTRLLLWNYITSSLPARHRSAPKGHDSNLSPRNPWSHFSLTKKTHCRLGIFLHFFPSQMMSGHWMPGVPVRCLFLGHLTTFQLFGHEGLQCLEVKVLQKWVVELRVRDHIQINPSLVYSPWFAKSTGIF